LYALYPEGYFGEEISLKNIVGRTWRINDIISP